MPHHGKSWYMIKKRNWIQNSYVHIRCKITPRWGLSIMHTQTNRSCKRWRCVPTCSNTPYDWGFVKIAHFRNPTHNLGYFQIWHEKWWSPVSEICKREHQLKSSSIKKKSRTCLLTRRDMISITKSTCEEGSSSDYDVLWIKFTKCCRKE